MDLSERVTRLEAAEEIKKLKAQYWYYCDHKDVERVRDCFADGEVEINYEGPVGLVRHRDGLYEVFKNVACHKNIVEIHHGGPPDIDVLSAEDARGRWSLTYHLMDTDLETLSVVGGYYDDEYRRIDGAWKISKARFSVVSAITYGWKDRAMKVLYSGAKLPSI